MMRAVLFGATGQLGRRLAPELEDRFHLQTPGRKVLDLSRPSSVTRALDALWPELIVNAAAYTAVDRAEEDAGLARAINGDSVGAMGRWCAANDATLIHVSTDFVFDGAANRPYREEDPTAPLGAYGASKLAGEQAIAASGCAHLILRTAWLYSADDGNFCATMLRLARAREELRVVADQTGSPTSADWLAEAMTAVLDRAWTEAVAHHEGDLAAAVRAKTRDTGVLHAVCAGETTWHGFASAIVEGARARGVQLACERVAAIGAEDYPTPATRPAYSVLDTARLARDWGVVPPDWRAALDRVLDQVAARVSA